jgi:hypothetical protein
LRKVGRLARTIVNAPRKARRGINRAKRNIGQGLGARLGRDMGLNYSTITGMGDYEVKTNTLVRPTTVPDFGINSVRLTHKEYLGDISGSVNFTSSTYHINPGLSATFPWLAGLARNYQQYRMNGMLYEFVSTSATALNSINTALGKVVIATNYNAEDPDFTSTVEMLTTQFSNYGKPSANLTHAIECAPSETASNLYYVRTDIEMEQKDLRLSDLGFTQVSTEGMQAEAVIGGLWVTYDVTFLKPTLNAEIAQSDGFDQCNFYTDIAAADIYNDITISPRNVSLGGKFYESKDSVTYQFNDGIASGYFLSLVEYPTPVENKLSGGTVYTLTGCDYVTDTDDNGPFSVAVIGKLPRLTTSFYNGQSVNDTCGFDIIIVKVSSKNATIQYAGVAANIGASVNQTWRASIWPINYNNLPDKSV